MRGRDAFSPALDDLLLEVLRDLSLFTGLFT